MVRLVPRYGNFWPGWTAGLHQTAKEWKAKGMEKVDPEDSMDALFLQHDTDYANDKLTVGDIRLIRGLEHLNPDPRLWPRPPKDISEAIEYRAKALDCFRAKVYGKTGVMF